MDNIFFFFCRKKCKFDKGAAMTVVYKKSAPGTRSGDEVIVAVEKDSNRLLFHQRINSVQKERNFSFPLVRKKNTFHLFGNNFFFLNY